MKLNSAIKSSLGCVNSLPHNEPGKRCNAASPSDRNPYIQRRLKRSFGRYKLP